MADREANTSGPVQPSAWPGERLGLQPNGPGSVARLGRRIGALLIDWGSAMLVSLLFARYSSDTYTWVVPVVFAVLQVVFIPTIGGSVGHRLCRIAVRPLDYRWVGVWRPLVRTVLLVLVVPALVWDSDHRGGHDKIAGTVLIRS